MKDAVVLALVSSIEEELERVQTVRGKRGLRGPSGTPFIFEDHKNEIYNFLTDYFKNDASFLDALRGEAGKDGKNGRDFIFEEHQDKIKEVIHSLRDALKLSFSDLTENEKISLKLKFSDLTSQEKEELRGPRGVRGQRGRKGEDGKDFVFEENQDKIKSLLPKKEEILSELPSKQELYDLVPKKEELKLKFEDLTEEDKHQLKGPRGHRGQRGKSGRDGKDVTVEEVKEVVLNNANLLRGPQGLPGVQGLQGLSGIDGLDGKDAAEVVDIEVLTRKEEIAFLFTLEDGREIKTNYISLPKKEIEKIFVAGGGVYNPSGIKRRVTLPANSPTVLETFPLSEFDYYEYNTSFKNLVQNLYGFEVVYVTRSGLSTVSFISSHKMGNSKVNVAFNVVGESVEFRVVNTNNFDVQMTYTKKQ